MTTSGTTDFNLSNADIVQEAYDRIGIRPAAITNDHMVSARRSLNLELANFSNRGVNLWAVDLQEIPLTADTTEYTLSPDTVIVLDVYISIIQQGTSVPIDRIMSPLGRTEYAQIPNKEQNGAPTVYWFDRTITPTLHIWQTAPQDGQYTLKYYRMRRIQDANPSLTQTADIPFRFLDALCAALAARLARKWKPDIADSMKLEATQTMTEAMTEDRERAPIYILPDLAGYYN